MTLVFACTLADVYRLWLIKLLYPKVAPSDSLLMTSNFFSADYYPSLQLTSSNISTYPDSII